jgi:hypothetical protein
MPIGRQQFESFFPRLVKDLEEHSARYGLPEQALKWFTNVSDFPVQA